jgi:DNA repair exonuclease SbcCD ATPase subunit
MCDSGKKANNLDTEIEGLHRELAAMKKRKVQISHHRNMDARSMQERAAQLAKERDRLNEEFSKAISEGDAIVKQFNDAKQKLLKSANNTAAAIDSKLRQKLHAFDENLQAYMQLNRLYARHLPQEIKPPVRNLDIQAVDESSMQLDSSRDILCDPQLASESDIEQMANFATEGSFLLAPPTREQLGGLGFAELSPETEANKRMVG